VEAFAGRGPSAWVTRESQLESAPGGTAAGAFSVR
jgi:hypothetical protein